MKNKEEIIEKTLNDLRGKQITAIDVFNKEFTINTEYIEQFVSDNIKEMLSIKSRKPSIEIESSLKFSNKRFCALYENKDDNEAIAVVDMPEDIFKFLVTNEYDNETIEKIAEEKLAMQYNYVEIIKKTLKIGRNFKKKNTVVNANTDEGKLCAIDYVTNKLNPIPSYILYSKYILKYGKDKSDRLLKDCVRLGIHSRTVLYRELYENMTTEKAIDIGIEESNKYGIRSEVDVKFTIGVKKICCNIIREYMKENQDKQPK